MSRRIPYASALVVLLCSTILAQAAAKPEPKKAKVASTPEEAVQFVAEAFKAGDPEALLAQLEDPGETKLMLTFQMAHHLLDSAVTKKLGKDPNNKYPITSIKERLQSTKKVVVVEKKKLEKNKVELTVWTTTRRERDDKDRILEVTWTAVKSSKGWKLLMPSYSTSSNDVVTKKGPDGKQVEVQITKTQPIGPAAPPLEYQRKVMPKILGAMKKVTKEVEEGKYKTHKEVQEALRKIQEKILKENPPPTNKPKEKPKGEPAKD